MADPSDTQERLNSGWAATEKKQRLCLQAIADHIGGAEKSPEAAQGWMMVQRGLLENHEMMFKCHQQHKDFWKDQGKPEDE